MKEDHLRNAQLKPGYNVQIAVKDILCNKKEGIL